MQAAGSRFTRPLRISALSRLSIRVPSLRYCCPTFERWTARLRHRCREMASESGARAPLVARFPDESMEINWMQRTTTRIILAGVYLGCLFASGRVEAWNQSYRDTGMICNGTGQTCGHQWIVEQAIGLLESRGWNR